MITLLGFGVQEGSYYPQISQIYADFLGKGTAKGAKYAKMGVLKTGS
jgi:hypothetical protein